MFIVINKIIKQNFNISLPTGPGIKSAGYSLRIWREEHCPLQNLRSDALEPRHEDSVQHKHKFKEFTCHQIGIRIQNWIRLIQLQGQYKLCNNNVAAQRNVLIVGIPLVAGLYVIRVLWGTQFCVSWQGVVSYLVKFFLSLVHKSLINADIFMHPF